jgi:THO complex subunit 1
MMGIMDDDLDLDMAQTEEDKDAAVRSKDSKIWRILRLSAKSKLAAFDKIEDGKNLKILFEAPQPTEGTPQALEGTPQAAEPAKASTEETTAQEESQENGNVGNGESKEDPSEEKPADSADSNGATDVDHQTT